MPARKPRRMGAIRESKKERGPRGINAGNEDSLFKKRLAIRTPEGKLRLSDEGKLRLDDLKARNLRRAVEEGRTVREKKRR